VSDTPFVLIQHLMANPKYEALINFMYEEVNRRRSQPQEPQSLYKTRGGSVQHWWFGGEVRALREGPRLYRPIRESQSPVRPATAPFVHAVRATSSGS